MRRLKKIPNMLIQPNLENAIWHGLRYRESQGMLTVKIQKRDSRMVISIEDNGIGISKKWIFENDKPKNAYISRIENVKERIHLLNKLYKSHIKLDIKDKQGRKWCHCKNWILIMKIKSIIVEDEYSAREVR